MISPWPTNKATDEKSNRGYIKAKCDISTLKRAITIVRSLLKKKTLIKQNSLFKHLSF